jgi:hypothetical protein
MKSIKLPCMTLEIGKGQPEYSVLHAAKIPGPEGELLMCFELTDEEIAEIQRTKHIYYSRLTFENKCRACQAPQPFMPMNIFVQGVVIIEEPNK